MLTASGQNKLEQTCKKLRENHRIGAPYAAEHGGVTAIYQWCDQQVVQSKLKSAGLAEMGMDTCDALTQMRVLQNSEGRSTPTSRGFDYAY